ncbi:MAG: hypothetical protein QOF42_2465 [Gammaproteobacteria bacterium]|jgi:hypothetical protein|nr:hypothetical protein [Gammaproteobacteria bacterium]
MRTLAVAIGLTAAALHTPAAVSQESEGASLSAKRQMVICMNKSMSVDKTLSYNQALKDCKERISASIGKRAVAANTVAANKTP